MEEVIETKVEEVIEIKEELEGDVVEGFVKEDDEAKKEVM